MSVLHLDVRRLDQVKSASFSTYPKTFSDSAHPQNHYPSRSGPFVNCKMALWCWKQSWHFNFCRDSTCPWMSFQIGFWCQNHPGQVDFAAAADDLASGGRLKWVSLLLLPNLSLYTYLSSTEAVQSLAQISPIQLFFWLQHAGSAAIAAGAYLVKKGKANLQGSCHSLFILQWSCQPSSENEWPPLRHEWTFDLMTKKTVLPLAPDPMGSPEIRLDTFSSPLTLSESTKLKQNSIFATFHLVWKKRRRQRKVSGVNKGWVDQTTTRDHD